MGSLSRVQGATPLFRFATAAKNAIERIVGGIPLLLSCFPGYLFGQNEDLKFEHIGLEQGLSQNTVWGILQDNQGFMWFATESGLNRYDGYNITVYKHDPDDPSSLSHNNIRSIYEDHTGVLWIGTDDGLNRFDRENETLSNSL